jgi:hypothetical protein
MKNLLLKMILAGLTLGLVPHAAAMNSTHSMQLRSRSRSNSIVRLPQSGAISLQELYLKYPELRQKQENPIHQETSIYAECSINILGLLTALVMMILCSTIRPPQNPECPSLDSAYKDALQINTGHTFNEITSCKFDSEKYGTVLVVDPELQKIINSNFTFTQLESVKQDGPTCAKYAFANMAAMEQLYRDGKPITSESIAKEVRTPLQAIGLPGERDWLDPVKAKPIHMWEGMPMYAKKFFPNNNFFTQCDDSLIDAANAIACKINSDGIIHILHACNGHATAISIIRDRENHYHVIYMNTHGTPLISTPDLGGWDNAKKCYRSIKNFVVQLMKNLYLTQASSTGSTKK